MIPPVFRIAGIAGSLRSGSYNRGMLRAAALVAPPDLGVDLIDLHTIPLYDADIDKAGQPDAVADMKRRIEAADGVLIVTPEYNGFFSGVLHNAIDWASRPAGSSSFKEKPTAMISVSTGARGGRQAQPHLRVLLQNVRAQVMEAPELYVGEAADKFDAEATLTDEATLEELRAFLAAFETWLREIAAAEAAA